MINKSIFLLCFILHCFLIVGAQEAVKSNRKAKQFFVTTTTSTTTLSTQSICWYQSHAQSLVISCPSGRKKRSAKSNEDGDDVELEGSERAARFVNYWMTITKSTTITSYTTTSTVSALFCTPFDFSYGPCVSSGHGK